MPGNLDLLLVGAGPMAVEYARVLKDKKIAFEVVGRGEASAKQFEEKTGIKPFIGLDEYLKSHSMPGNVIIAVNVETLASCAEQLIKSGAKNILLEKPGAIYSNQLSLLNDLAKEKKSKLQIAYN